LGAHSLAFQRIDGGRATISTPALTTQGSGSLVLASVGRGDARAFTAPTDNKGNTFGQVGTTHRYTRWPGSGTALYAMPAAAGGAGHVVSVATPPTDEVTLAVVEVKGGGQIIDSTWAEVAAGRPLTSPSVHTTAPATLVAFWWGDADVSGDKTAVPDQGFTVLDSVLEAGALVQAAVAIKQVPGAGEYNVTWVSTPTQGAQLYLVAIQ
jgi:hypothetical protein